MGVVKAGKQDKGVFQGLMQRYLHDLSPYTGDSPDAHGYYDFGKYFDAYWERGKTRLTVSIQTRWDANS